MIITIDLETRFLAQDLEGGWADLKAGKGGCSALVMWNNMTERPHLYDDHCLSSAADVIEASLGVLSFNGVEFDIPVIEGILGRSLKIKHHLDLLQLVWDALPPGRHKGFKLTELAERCLGRSKTGDGALAPRLADEGRYGELFDYCLHDVYLTRKLFQFAQENGGVVDLNGEILTLNLPYWFKDVDI